VNFGVVLLSVMAILTVFSLVGLGVMLNAFRVGRQERRSQTGEEKAPELREKIRRYIGPVDPKTRLLNPGGRVAVEFVGAFCGFPGLGWLCSGSVFTGLLLICCVPAFAWGIYPVILAVSGKLLSSPYIVMEYLPGVAVASAGALAYREVMLARERRRAAARGEGREG
jgi:TM2 domain-containing membrane protein YozV